MMLLMINFTVYTLKIPKVEPIHIELQLNGKNTLFELDTGNLVTLVTMDTYKELYEGHKQIPKLEDCTLELKTYRGEDVHIKGEK